VEECGIKWRSRCPVPGVRCLMFYGEHMHTLDAKGRLTMPAKYRSQLAEGILITKGEDRCLQIWPAREWEAKRIEVEQRGVSSRQNRRMMRGVFGGTWEGELDKSGRVLIETGLRDYGNLDKECAVVGLGRFIEIWDASLWDDERGLAEEEIADRDDSHSLVADPE
jgi:MraZ protein